MRNVALMILIPALIMTAAPLSCAAREPSESGLSARDTRAIAAAMRFFFADRTYAVKTAQLDTDLRPGEFYGIPSDAVEGEAGMAAGGAAIQDIGEIDWDAVERFGAPGAAVESVASRYH